MRKTLRLALLTALTLPWLASATALAGTHSTPAPPRTAMSAGILVDVSTGKVLWSKNSTQVRSPASLTKVLTALTVLEYSALDGYTTISKAARAVDGGRTYAEEGWRFTMRDLLWGLLLQSGNDAAIALAENASPDGSVEGFMSMANALAARLGAGDSNFVNPHGLDAPGQVSTARDLAIITTAALEDPRFVEMVSSKTHIVPWGDRDSHMFINHNKLLWRYEGTIGVKTGFTNQAGPSLISAVQRDGSTLMAVVLGSGDHYGDSTALYDWGFANLHELRAASQDRISPNPSGDDVALQTSSSLDQAGLSNSPIDQRIPVPLLAAVISAALVTAALLRRVGYYQRNL
ncbi:MAG: D-alanyl-D-alanine carboxypeptidase family protein [Actinomycetota bacterium]